MSPYNKTPIFIQRVGWRDTISQELLNGVQKLEYNFGAFFSFLGQGKKVTFFHITRELETSPRFLCTRRYEISRKLFSFLFSSFSVQAAA